MRSTTISFLGVLGFDPPAIKHVLEDQEIRQANLKSFIQV